MVTFAEVVAPAIEYFFIAVLMNLEFSIPQTGKDEVIYSFFCIKTREVKADFKSIVGFFGNGFIFITELEAPT